MSVLPKQLGVKRKDVINFCLDHGYLYRDKKNKLLPRANKKARDLFQVVQCYNEKTKWAGSQTLLTPKGIETLRLLLLDASERRLRKYERRKDEQRRGAYDSQ